MGDHKRKRPPARVGVDNSKHNQQADTNRNSSIRQPLQFATLAFIPDKPWLSDDADWFRQHRNRKFRLRRIFPGEISIPDPATTHMVVYQVYPGLRQKMELSSTAGDKGEYLDRSPDSDIMLRAFWQAGHNSSSIVPMSTVFALAHQFAREGR